MRSKLKATARQVGAMKMDHAWAVVSEAARDPLIVAFFAIALGVVVARIVFRRSPLGRAIVRVALLVLLTIALLRGGIVPDRPLQSTDAPLHDLAVAVRKMTWWLWGAWLLVGFVRALLVFERRPPEGKLVQTGRGDELRRRCLRHQRLCPGPPDPRCARDLRHHRHHPRSRAAEHDERPVFRASAHLHSSRIVPTTGSSWREERRAA